MRIDQLTLQNFRGIREGSFEFPRAPERREDGNGSFNLLVGPNGAGKSSILEGLAVAASGLFLSMRGTDVRHVRHDDAHVVIKRFEDKALRAPQYPVLVTASGKVDGNPLDWTRSLDTEDGRTNKREAKQMSKISGMMGKRAIAGWEEVLPLVSYYSADRLWKEPKDMVSKRRDPGKARAPHEMHSAPKTDVELARDKFSLRVSGHSNSVNGRCSPRDLQRWLGFEDYKAYKQKKESIHSFIVREAIRYCQPGVEEVIVDSELGLLFYKDSNWIEFRHLSEGQRNMAALVGDIAWKASQLNPHLGERALRETPGVVFIDELDMHLHPEWQRMIVRKLQEIFPEIQFICATHSPQIIGEVPAEEIRILEDGDDYAPSYSQGIDSSRVLDEIMGGQSRPIESSELIREIAVAMDSEDFPTVESLLGKLSKALGENDPEVTRVRTLMDFLQET